MQVASRETVQLCRSK